MKNILCLSIFYILIICNSYSQDEQNFLTFSANTSFEIEKINDVIGKKLNVFGLMPSFGYQKENDRILHQFELMPFYIFSNNYKENHYVPGESLLLMRSYFNWNLKYSAFGNTNWKTNLYISNGIYYNYIQHDPSSAAYFMISNHFVGISTNIGIELERKLFSNIAILFSMVYNLNNFYLQSSYTSNPSISERIRRVNELNNDFTPPIFNSKFGLKIKI